MNLDEDLRFYWTMFTDEEILARIEKAVGFPLPQLGSVPALKLVYLARNGYIRLRARSYDDLLFCIDAEKSWESFLFADNTNSSFDCSFIVEAEVDNKQIQKSFAAELASSQGRYITNTFIVLEFDKDGHLKPDLKF